MLEKLKLRGRILTGYAVPVGLFILTSLAIGGLTIERNRRSDLLQKSQELYDRVKDVSTATAAADRDGTLLILYSLTPQGDPQNPYDFAGDYKKSVAAIQPAIDRLNQLVVPSDQRATIERLNEVFKKNFTLYANLSKAMEAGNPRQAALDWSSKEANEITTEYFTLFEDFFQAQQKVIDQRSKELERIVDVQTYVVFGATIVAALSSIWLGLQIAARITKSVNDLVAEVSDSSQEIAVSIASQERVVAEQAASVNQTTATMEELGASSQKSAEQAKTSTERAQEALDLSVFGQESLQRTLEGINALRDKVLEFAQKIIQLSEQTGQISTVSELVAALAKQTNTLALNAAVEAARAGEQGKGFSVVAQEVRKLADQSKKSAQKINILIEEIQASINSTVIVTEESTKTATESILLAQSTADAFESIAKAIDSVFINTQQIALSSKQQALGVQQIVSAMNSINLGARETAQTITHIKSATEHLSESAKVLQETV